MLHCWKSLLFSDFFSACFHLFLENISAAKSLFRRAASVHHMHMVVALNSITCTISLLTKCLRWELAVLVGVLFLIFRDPLMWSTLFSYTVVHILIFLHIQKELSYTNLISRGLLQKQSSFDEIGKSLRFLISDVWTSEITVQYAMYNLC